MSSAKSLSHIFIAATVGAFLAFTWLGHHADSAMDKTGRGNLSEFERYSTFAGFSFWAMVFFWMLAIVYIQYSPQTYRSRALLFVGLLVPVTLIVVYILCTFTF
jgi:hypothetical protein